MFEILDYLKDRQYVLRFFNRTPIPEIKNFQKLFDVKQEGIICKHTWSRYLITRASYWQKIKHQNTLICDIVDFTEREEKNAGLFGSLVMALKGKYVGIVGVDSPTRNAPT